MNRTADAVIFFADVVGSARLSDVLDPVGYDKLVREYQSCLMRVFEKVSQRLSTSTNIACVDGGVRGDEGVLILALENPGIHEKTFVAQLVLESAVKLAVTWLICDANCNRVDSSASPIGISIGLHFGPVVIAEHPRGRWESADKTWAWVPSSHRKTPEGFSINFGKRVEGAGRHSRTGMTISQSFFSLCRDCGIPIHVGPDLDKAETKGFEQREPIYELEGQDVVSDLTWLTDNSANQLDRFRKNSRRAFNRDPFRSRWFLELAIEHDFRAGNYNDGFSLAEQAMNVQPTPSLMWRAARCLHRRAASPADRVPAIDYYRSAAQDDSFVWARLDLAAALWKNRDYQRAIHECEEVIKQQPRHFYAYNLLALTLADLNRGKQSPDVANQEELRRAHQCLDRARSLHKAPEYLYFGTEASIRKAAGEDVSSVVADARRTLEVAKQRGSDRIPSEDFWQPGFAVPGFCPPRPESLEESWKGLCNG